MPAGSVSGLVARGGSVADMTWGDGELSTASIRLLYGSNLTIAINGDDRQYVMRTVDGRELDRSGWIVTIAGQTYFVTASDR
jgi:hypothetical protein